MAMPEPVGRSFGPATAKYRELGTAPNLLTFNRLGRAADPQLSSGAPSRGPSDSRPRTLAAAQRVARASCAACTIGCEHIYAAASGEVRLEYETLFALGRSAASATATPCCAPPERATRLGLDTITAGATIAFAMECAENGLLDGRGSAVRQRRGSARR